MSNNEPIDLISDEGNNNSNESDSEDSVLYDFVEKLLVPPAKKEAPKSKKKKVVKYYTSKITKLNCDDKTLQRARETVTSFTIDWSSVDKKGVGVKAKVDLKQGKLLVDESATYQHGKVPSNWNYDERGNYIKTSDGYFILRTSPSEWMNEARCEEHQQEDFDHTKCKNCLELQNVAFRCDKINDKPTLAWRIMKDISKGEELLTIYHGK